VPWHYNARCKTCDFVNKCREDAEGSVAMIPYMSIDNAEFLKAAIKYWKVKDLNDGDGEHGAPNNNNSNDDIDVDIEDLSNYFQSININNENSNDEVDLSIKKIIKYNKVTKVSPYLKAI